MTKRTKTVVIILAIVLLVIFGGLYFFYSFLSAFAPPKVTVTERFISCNRGFINGVTIQKLLVDSIGNEKYPVKYAVTYMTTCSIDHPGDKPPNPPQKITFAEKGKYWWTEEHVNIRFIHYGMTRETLDSTQRLMWSMGSERFATCPLKFEKEQWYFFTIGDPQVTGIFFYIDRSGKEEQYFIASGVSPI